VGLGFLIWLRFALRGLALWRVCAIAPSFVLLLFLVELLLGMPAPVAWLLGGSEPAFASHTSVLGIVCAHEDKDEAKKQGEKKKGVHHSRADPKQLALGGPNSAVGHGGGK
jgi:hypothetical protein